MNARTVAVREYHYVFCASLPASCQLALRRRCSSLVLRWGSHGAPAVWLGAKGTYPIYPILRRRYLASLSLSRSRVEVRLNAQSGKGDALHFALICLEVKDSPHELCLQPLPQVLIYAPIGIAAFVADFLHRQVGYVALSTRWHRLRTTLELIKSSETQQRSFLMY